jgi:hypothetical protein
VSVDAIDAATVSGCALNELPRLLGRLAELEAMARLRIATASSAPESTTAVQWLTPERAAEVAGVTARRVYRWAARPGVRWASRLSRKCLRVREDLFTAWLATSRA